VWAGFCTWPQLDELGTADLLAMHRSLNLKDHLEFKAEERARERRK
jgi:hypothetical protein